MTTRLANRFWREVRIAARETPRMYFGTVKDIAEAMARMVQGKNVVHIEPTPVGKQAGGHEDNLVIFSPKMNNKKLGAGRGAVRIRSGGLKTKNRAVSRVRASDKEIVS